MKYKSVTHITSGKRSTEEVVFEHERTLWDRIMKRPGKKETYVRDLMSFDNWVNKDTGKPASKSKGWEIFDMIYFRG
jgi:hypothetical protein